MGEKDLSNALGLQFSHEFGRSIAQGRIEGARILLTPLVNELAAATSPE